MPHPADAAFAERVLLEQKAFNARVAAAMQRNPFKEELRPDGPRLANHEESAPLGAFGPGDLPGSEAVLADLLKRMKEDEW